MFWFKYDTAAGLTMVGQEEIWMKRILSFKTFVSNLGNWFLVSRRFKSQPDSSCVELVWVFSSYQSKNMLHRIISISKVSLGMCVDLQQSGDLSTHFHPL